MKLTLEEFFNRENSTAKNLKEALETNLSAIVGDELDAETKDLLMRVNLISIRICLQVYGDPE